MKKTKLRYFTCRNVDPLSDISVLHFKHEFNHYKHPEEERHVRNFYKITLIAKGNGILFCNNRELPIGPGTLFLVHPDDLTSYRILSGYLEIYDVLFKENLLREYRTESRELLPVLQEGFRPASDASHLLLLKGKREMTRLIRLMYGEMRSNSPEHSQIETAYLRVLLLYLERERRNQNRENNSEKFVRLVRVAIESEYGTGFCFQTLAEKAGVSPAHLGRIFHRASGMSISEALKKHRLQVAADLLSNSGDSVSTIAFRSGFHDPSTFFREFRKEYGMTPLAYRGNYGIK